MFKNTAAKFMVFAFDVTTNTAKTGDAANITAYVSKDYGTVTVLADTSATEMDSTNAKGYYLFDAAQGETNGDVLMISAKSATGNITVIGAPAVIFTRPATGWLAPTTAARTVDVASTGEVGLDFNNVLSSALITLHSLTITGVTTHTGNVILSDGITISAPSTGNRAGVTITGNGTGAAISLTGGATGQGILIAGGGTSGDGIKITTTSGHGLNLAPVGTNMHGILATGGNGGTSDGIKAVAGTGGVPIRGDITGNINGTVATLTTYTGNTPQTGDSFARIGATGSGLTSITGKTDNLPSDPADESLIIAATDAIMTRLGVPAATVSADIAAVKSDTAAILVDTGTTLDGRIPAALVGGKMDSTISGLTASDVGAIKAKTDSLTFTIAGQVDGNIQSVNDVQVTGDGSSGTPWGP